MSRSKGYVSEILNRKKALPKDVIRILTAHFKISQEALNRPYGLMIELAKGGVESSEAQLFFGGKPRAHHGQQCCYHLPKPAENPLLLGCRRSGAIPNITAVTAL